MTDNKTSVDEVAELLNQAKVEKFNSVSFKGRALKLDTVDDAREIIEAIRDCKDMQVLELVGNTVGVDAANLIANELKKHPELEQCLWADMFTGRLRSEIPISLTSLGNAMIEANTHLVVVDLSDNAFGPDCAKACVPLLKSPACFTLQELYFNNNGLGGGGIILADTLIECHEKSKSTGKPLQLKVFVAGRNRLENPGAKALAKAFKTIGTLEEIQLPQNGIQHEGIVALAEAVTNSPNLKHLNLNDNIFTEKGAVPMAAALQKIDSLEIINFGDCLVRTKGAKALGDSLKKSNPNLKQLIACFGEVELEGGIAICEAMSNKSKLEKLDLNGNQFGEDGVEEIRDMAKDFMANSALASLSDDEGEDDSEEEEQDEDSGSDGDAVTNGHSYDNINVENFLSNITSSILLQIPVEELDSLMQDVADNVHNAEATADAFMKLSGLLSENCLSSINSCDNAQAEKLRNAVFLCMDVLSAAAFDKYPNTPMLVINPMLVKMGLLKSEDKTFKAPSDIRRMVVVLGHVSQQPYFPKYTKKIVRQVATKENKQWNEATSLQSQLLQLLYW